MSFVVASFRGIPAKYDTLLTLFLILRFKKAPTLSAIIVATGFVCIFRD